MKGKMIYKAGLQSASDPFEFVMSTAAVDRMGDIVEQSWDLKSFKKNPIALWNHNSREPIGRWEDVRVEGNKLLGRLRFADPGTSEAIDTLRSLVDQKILKAVSVGFRSKTQEPLDKEDPWGPMRLSDNELLECSLCSVPANQQALATGKSINQQTEISLFGEPVDDPMFLPAGQQLKKLKSRGSGKSDHTKQADARRSKMRLSERIENKQTELTTLKNQLSELMDGIGDDGDFDDETKTTIEELNVQIDEAETSLATFQAAERRLQVTSAPESKAPQPTRTRESRIESVPKKREKGALAIRAIACMIRGFGSKTSPLLIAKETAPEDSELSFIIRAATDPATTTDAAWAAPLVQTTWGEYLDLIRDMSVYPRVPGSRIEFDRYGLIKMPKNTGRGKMPGAWVGELNPIPVVEGAFGAVDLSPKKLGVISSFSDEIGRHSIPQIEALIRDQILGDTAEALDGYYVDNGARSALRPAGLQDPTETGAANIVAATGTTVADIISDTKGMITRMMQSRSGSTAVWIMNPIHVLGLEDTQDAASGDFPFKAELANGTFRRYAVLTSQNIPENLVILQSSQCMAHGNDYAPLITTSDTATLVFDDTAPDQIVSGGPGSVTEQPVKSMFQVHGTAVKMVHGLDWRITRQGGVQVLTGVNW